MDVIGLPLLLASLRLSAPLAIAAMGELVAERAGVLNIGIEGMMLGGAFAAFALGAVSGSVSLALCAGILAGAALAALFALFVIGRNADPIVCGTAINVLALGATGSGYRLLLPPGASPLTSPQMPEFAGINAFVLIAALLVPAIALFLLRTRWGLSVRAVGERAEAAHSQGVSVLPIRWAASIFGGGCAGLAGASLVLWLSDTFVEGMTSGRGFIALSLVLFGGYRPLRIVAGALLFGGASALQFRLQAMGAEIPYNLLLMTPYVLTLVVLTLLAGRVRAPADLGRPFVQRE
ncbi:MAG: ABC transporter permease [Myxococcota bacterium]